MGRPKPAEVKKTETTDQSFQNKNVSDTTHGSTGMAGGMNVDSKTGGSDTSTTGMQETAAQRKARSEQASRTTGGTTTTGTGRQDTTSRTGGSSENVFAFTDRPDTADTKKFRENLFNYEGVQDPTISYNAANQREQVLRMAQNPLGAYTTPESRQAITQSLFSQIGQQEGQSYLQDAFNRSQQKLQTLGLQGQLANMTQPLRELMGTKQSQEASQTGVSSQDQTQAQDLSTMTTGSSTQDDLSQMKSMTDQISNYFQDAFGSNVGFSQQDDVSHGEQTGSGTSHGTNTGVQTSVSEQPNIWNQVIGGAANMAAFM